MHRPRPPRIPVVLFCGLLALAPAAADPLEAAWQSLTFASLPHPWQQDGACAAMLTPTATGLQLQLLIPADADAVVPDTLAVHATLQRADGTRIDAQLPLRHSLLVAGGSLGGTASWVCSFPWSGPQLEEAWIELRLAGQEHWLEIPYGLYQAADAAPLESVPTERPERPRGMGDGAQIVPWSAVQCDLGALDNGWRLGLVLANPYDASAVLTLYKDDNSRGLRSWDLHSPRTRLLLGQPDYELEAVALAIERHSDGFRRSDRFSFPRNPGAAGRYHCELRVMVDDAMVSRRLPSSLFKLRHGH